MSKIVFLMLPEPGHLLPSIRVADTLRLRGHCVEYVTLPEYKEFLTERGLGWRPFLLSLIQDGIGGGTIFESKTSGRNLYISRLQADDTLSQKLTDELTSAHPDLVILDSAMCVLLRPQREPAEILQLTCPILRMATGFPDVYRGPEVLQETPELVLCPREFELLTAGPPPVYRDYVEPSVLRAREVKPFPWSRLSDAKRLIYCSFGSQSSAYQGADEALRKVIAAFENLPLLQLVVAVGGHRTAEEFGDVPKNVLLAKSVPQLEILRLASLAITHGGLGTIKEAILMGIPIIVLPFLHDQPANAQRVVQHGLGAALSPMECSVTEVQDAVTKVLHDGKIRTSVQTFKRLFESMECESPSVTHIENALVSQAATR